MKLLRTELFNRLESIPRSMVLIIGILLVLGLGVIDFFAGPRVYFSIFYIIPLLTVSWYAGLYFGVAMSAFIVTGWLSIHMFLGGNNDHNLLYWNAGIELSLFLFVNYLVTKLKELLELERYLARTDQLTKVTNRRYFIELADNELKRCQRYCHQLTLAYIDLDNFKEVNDRLGHHVGDRLLATVAAMMRANTRSVDTVARLGGDEFAIMFPETGGKAVNATLDKLRIKVAEIMDRNNWPVTFSIGAVTFITPPASVTEMLKDADAAMYSAKRTGKNATCYKIQE